MTKKKKSLMILIVSVLALLAAGIVIALVVFRDNIAKAENTYDPYYESFYTGENDLGIKIDGKLDEDIWKDKNWFQDTYLSKPNVKMPSWKITSHMTDMGVYIAAYIEDNNIMNDGQHTMEANTSLEFYYFVSNVGEEISGKGIDRGYMVVDMRGDVHGTTGKFKRAVVVDGKVNSGKTKSATMEMFFPWEFFKVDTGKGIPANLYLYPVYCAVFEGKETISTSISSMDSVVKPQLYLYKDYWRFNKDGYATADRKGAVVGDSVTGLAKTGNWDISQEKDGVVRSANGTREHYMYFTDKFSSDFMVETTIVPVKQKASDAKAGFYFLTGDGQYHLVTLNTPNSLLIDSVNGTKNLSKYIMATYDNKNGIWDYQDECRAENPNAKKQEGVKLTVVKNGGKLWYFVDDKFMTSEQKEFMDTEVIPAFYAWAADVEFKDYSCTEMNEEQAKKYLNERGVYSVDAKVKGSGGTVEASKIAVAKGQKYDITVTCNSGYEVSSLLVNGRECLADAKKHAKGGVYTITADAQNQEIVVSFKKCNGPKLSGVVKGGGKALSATLTITCDNNGILRYVVSAKEDKGYQVVMPVGRYTIVVEAEDYIMDTVKVTLNKDTKKDITLKPSMFAAQVKVNGKTVSSNTKVWDRTKEAAGKIYGSYNKGTSLQPLYFAKTGNAAWFHSTIRYATNFVEGGSYQSDLLGGLWISDGSRTGWFGIRQHGIVYNSTWVEKVIGYDVLSTWDKQHLTADVDFILQNGEFHIYVDGIYATKLAVTKILPGADRNAALAFGLVMHADKMADIEFSNISFSTDAKQIARDFAKKQASHTIPGGTIFAQEVTVNGSKVQSKPYRWDLAEIRNNTVTCKDGISNQPIWFAKTGKTALIQTTVSRVDNINGATGYETQPLAGIMVSDGAKEGFFGIRASAIVTNDKWDHVIGRDLFASWQKPMIDTAELEVALKDNQFHIYIDGIFVKAVKVSDVIPGARNGATLALGLTSEASGKTASMKFGNVRYTTDASAVNAFLDSKDPNKAIPAGTIFAGVVRVNGREVQSVVPVWDITNIANRMVIGKNGGVTHPLYFANTGNTALVETTVTRVDDKKAAGSEGQPMAGIMITDGTHSGFLGVRAYSVVYGSTWLEKAIGYDVFVRWSDAHQTADIDFVLKNNQIHIYVDGIFVKTVKVSDVAPGIADGATVAIGLLMNADGKTAQMRFSDVNYTTEAAKVEAYLDAASGDDVIPSSSIFASKVKVNGKELQSIIPIWDLTDIANNTVIGNNGGSSHPLYFKATGKTALVEMTVTRLDDKTVQNRESQPMAGIIVSDGTNQGFVGVRASAVVTNDFWDHMIGRDLFATWSSVTKADIDIVLKDNEIRIYVDDVFMKKVKISDVVPGIKDGADVAIGLLMEASGKTAQMKFSDVQFTTEAGKIDAYIEKQEFDPSIKDFIEYARALGQGYENGVGSNKIPVSENTSIFIGDSFFERKRFWTGFYTNDYADADAFCAGIGSTTTDNWKHLIKEVFAVYGDKAPKNIVMHLGTNDLWSDTTSADDVVNGLKAVFDILHTKYPQTEIYYFGITHRGDHSAADRINAVNSTISTWSKTQDYLTYINTPAKITADMLNADKLHPKAETYALFVKELAKAGCVILDKNGQPLPTPGNDTLSGPFADEVAVNGLTVYSANDKWDISETDMNILKGSYAKGSSLKPIYFAKTGKTMLLQTTMEYTTVFETGKSYQGDLMGGLYVSDGTNTGYFGVRQHGVVYSPWLEWISNVWPYSVLAKWEPAHMKAQVDIALKDGVFYIYVDGLYSTTLNLSKIMPNTAKDADLAFGLTMHADKDCDIKFSDIKFTTNAEEVNEFLNVRTALAGTQFAESITVNGMAVSTAADKWDLSRAKDNILRAASDLGSTLQPVYFKQTGNTMLLQTTVTVTNKTAGDPMAGIWLHDGTRRAFIGVRGSGLFYSPAAASWNGWYGEGYWPTQELAPGWGGAATADIDIVLKDGTLTIYVNELYNKSVALKDVMPNLAADAQLAFGLVAYTDGTRVYDMTFSNIQFTTEDAKVDAFINKRR